MAKTLRSQCKGPGFDSGQGIRSHMPQLRPSTAKKKKKSGIGNSLAVQWLRLHTSSAGGAGLIPGQGTRIPHATRHSQKVRKKERKKSGVGK